MAYDPRTGTVTFPGFNTTADILAGRAPTARSAQPTGGMTDLERLTKLMQGNLSGSLSTGDKLMALSGLLGSVARGSRTTPQEVMAQLQQQKIAEVQGRMQLEQMRRQAEQAANLAAEKQQFINSLPADQQAQARLLSDEDFRKILASRLGQQIAPEQYAPTEEMKNAAELFPKGSPAYKAYIQALIAAGKTIATPAGVVNVPGVTFERKVVTDKNGNPVRIAIIGGVPYEE